VCRGRGRWHGGGVGREMELKEKKILELTNTVE
jgi:hypothetical protein